MENFNLKSCFPYPFVGLYGCSSIPESKSGIYVNDLEGINIIRFSQLTDAENPTVAAKFKSIYNRSLSEFYQDILSYLAELEIEFNSTPKGLTYVGQLGENSSCTSFYEVGFDIEKLHPDPFYLQYIESISFTPCSEYTFTVFVKEMGEITKEIIFKTTPGIINTIPIKYSTFANNFQIILRICGNEFYDVLCSNCTSHCEGNCFYYSCPCFKVQPITRDEELIISYKNVSSNGLRLSGACICDPTALICKYASQLAIPFKYKIGIAILEDAHFSDNITPLTTGNKENNIELLKLWAGGQSSITGEFVEGKYTRTLKNTLKFIAKTANKTHSDCIVCTGYKYVKDIF